MSKPQDLSRFLENGKLTVWPGKKQKDVRRQALEFFAEKFEEGKTYSEKEVNDVLNEYHTFGDPAFLRRELFDRGYMNRTADGSKYWREESSIE